MDYKLTKLENGISLLVTPMPFLESMTVSVWVRTGSRVENEKTCGVAHFLEHMAFKGGRKYSSSKKVSEAIDSIGGEFNASTSKETTKYYVKARATHVEKALDVLSDIVLFPTLKREDIEKEKKVIIEELRMYEDTPVRRVWDLFEQLIFEGHELGRDIIGNVETIKSLKREDFISYREENYHSQNILISIAGNVKDGFVESLVNKFFKEIKKDGNTIKKNFLDTQSTPRLKIKYKDIEQAHIILGFPADPLGSQERYKDSVMNAVLGGGMSSRLFTEVREKRGLAYAVRSEIERFLDAGYLAFYVGTDPAKGGEAVKVILNQLYGLSAGKIKLSKKELQKAKEFIKGHFALSLEDTSEVVDFFGYEQLMLAKTRTPKEVFDKIDKVNIGDIFHQAKKIFEPKKLNLCIIGPYKDDKDFRKILS